ncbi:Pentatricopeptide repeat [Macleaya cordata]|uniref:Pentatricopeptide repeat n=1 Tax=Macleaya cordata TaxID=56857 RepID=A0A200R3H9_MACCD|nr:Pentatricopeptide repeat [Macleaya cordata]
MAIGTMKNLYYNSQLLRCSLFHSIPSSSQTLEESIKAAIETKTYHQIPDLLISTTTTSSPPYGNPNNPFSFLSSFSQPLKTKIIDEILQSFIPLRPRSRPQIAYAYLLSYTLQDPNPFPLALAVLQRTLRSGCLPSPQTHLSLSSAWLDRRQHCSLRSTTVFDILSEVQSIGYRPDRGTCNYLISSLCAVDELGESVRVLEGMGSAGCDPDSESYGTVISAMCEARRTKEAEALVREMGRVGVVLRQGTVGRIVAAMKANGEVRRGVQMVRWLEREGYGGGIGFEVYEMVVEGCLERGEFILAGEMVMDMAEKGFIPYVGVRLMVFERLVGVGKPELAYLVRQKLATLKS